MKDKKSEKEGGSGSSKGRIIKGEVNANRNKITIKINAN